MIATEKLRALLDERGVEHEDSHEVTVPGISEWYATIWHGVAGVRYIAVSCDDCDGKEGCVYLYGAYLTPEQAIAATLPTVDGSTHWHELFGTPERAAVTLVRTSDERAVCKLLTWTASSNDYEAWLEWLNEEVEQ